MNKKILVLGFVTVLTACGNTSPLVGSWIPEKSDEEWVISQTDKNFNVSVSTNAISQGTYPIVVKEKQFTFAPLAGLGLSQVDCSLANRNQLNCALTVSSLFSGNQTTAFVMNRKK
jgi:hypothetical protein